MKSLIRFAAIAGLGLTLLGAAVARADIPPRGPKGQKKVRTHSSKVGKVSSVRGTHGNLQKMNAGGGVTLIGNKGAFDGPPQEP
jgi:hypothetical protein